jgi:peptidoglycan/LPS O-acetylase OafA/YrhL
MNTHAMPHPDRRRADRRQPAGDGARHGGSQHAMAMGHYGRVWAMVATSTVIGFGGMYLNTYQVDHVFFSWTRVFMAMIMGGIMTAVMMLFMWRMYPNKRANAGILGVAALLFLAGLALVRTQATVDDVAYMRAMIPHHSIAILTSSRARIEDPRVRKLADGIIATQKKEIGEMKALIEDLDR